jgi:5-methylcytosine-specific restriction endonuclease McrA
MGRNYNNGKWTPARFRSFVVSALRSASRRWPPKYEVLAEAKTEKKINSKTKRLAQHFQCKECKEEVTAKDIQIDHISAIVPPEDGFTSWDDFIERLFCEKENLQPLCRSCHSIKTKKERDARKQRTTT